MQTKAKRNVMRNMLVVIVALILAVVAAIFYGVLREQGGVDKRERRAGSSLCAEYGIMDSDPRSNPAPLPDTSTEEIKLHQPFTAHGIDGSYHLFARGVDMSQPVGVVVRLHGDDAFEYRNPEGLINCMAAVAASHNMILVVPHTPDRETRTWWKDIESNQEWLSALVPQLTEQYPNLDPEKTWWFGYSGGAEMISYALLANIPEQVSAGAIMVGGGGAPTDVSEPQPAVNRDVPLRWYVGSDDDGSDPDATFNAVDAAQQGSKWYSKHGYSNVTKHVMDDEDHFSIPQAQILEEVLSGQV